VAVQKEGVLQYCNSCSAILNARVGTVLTPPMSGHSKRNRLATSSVSPDARLDTISTPLLSGRVKRKKLVTRTDQDNAYTHTFACLTTELWNDDIKSFQLPFSKKNESNDNIISTFSFIYFYTVILVEVRWLV